MQRRYYCREENQDITKQDIQSPQVRAKIQAYMLSRGFPDEWEPQEYSRYFELIFGEVDLTFRGSNASIASTVAALGRCSNR